MAVGIVSLESRLWAQDTDVPPGAQGWAAGVRGKNKGPSQAPSPWASAGCRDLSVLAKKVRSEKTPP